MTAVPVPFIARDTVSPQGLEPGSGFQAVMPYRDGLYRWPAEQVRRFRDAGKIVLPVTIDGHDPHNAQIADCERGDLTPAAAARWAHQRNQLHRDSTIYCDLNTVPAVVEALGAEPAWLLVAWWTGKPVMPQLNLPAHIRVAGVQYASHPAYDESAIVNPFWPCHPFTNLANW
jgi:hypothetical protein